MIRDSSTGCLLVATGHSIVLFIGFEKAFAFSHVKETKCHMSNDTKKKECLWCMRSSGNSEDSPHVISRNCLPCIYSQECKLQSCKALSKSVPTSLTICGFPKLHWRPRPKRYMLFAWWTCMVGNIPFASMPALMSMFSTTVSSHFYDNGVIISLSLHS